ncbi:MAG: hypothetical protein ACRDRH_08405 [Pseudonocardia sp.]
MDTIAPIVNDAFALLRTDLYLHLDEAEFLASKTDWWSSQDVDAARELIPDLLLVIRGLWTEHEATPGGDCRTCRSVWPCPVVTTIHALVKDPDRAFVAILRRANDDE